MIQPPRRNWLRLVLGTLLAAGSTARAEVRVTIQGGPVSVKAALVETEVGAAVAPGDYQLVPVEPGGIPLRASVARLGSAHRLAVVVESLPADQSRSYRLERFAERSQANATAATAWADRAVHLTADGPTVQIKLGGAPFATHVVGERKPYLFPVLGPGDRRFTRAYPMESVEGEERDHPHQRSFWFTHGNVNGIDFWAADPKNPPNPKFGTIQERVRVAAVSGLAAGHLLTRNDWLGPDGKRICEDQREFRFWTDGQARYIDLDVTLTASDGPVVFGDTKEGSFGLRVPSSIDVKRGTGGRIVNADGVTNQAAWGKASPWVDYSGPIAGRTAGIAIFNHPQSFRYPTTWHVRDYGLFAANPFGYKDFGRAASGEYRLEPGQSLQLRYRVMLHEGGAAQADVAGRFAGYATPPRLVVESN